MKPGPIVVRRAIAALIVALPVLVGAIYSLASGIDPADTWSDSTARAGAPTVVDDSVLVDARRATGEASSQAGLLTGGTKQLVDGVAKSPAAPTIYPPPSPTVRREPKSFRTA